MKFNANVSIILPVLSALQKVINKKAVLDVLRHVLLRKVDGKYFLTASTSENELTMPVEIAEVDMANFKSCCIDVEKIIPILGTLGDQLLEFDLDDDYRMKVNYDGGSFAVPYYAGDVFPILPAVNEPVVTFSIPTDVFLKNVLAAQTFADTDPATLRPVMASVLLDVDNEGCTFVGTCGHTLYRNRYYHGVPFLAQGEPQQIMIPQAFVRTLTNPLRKTEMVTISCDVNRICITAGDVKFVMRSVEGRYPNYNAVIPKSNPNHIVVNKAALQKSLQRVSLLSSSISNQVCFCRDQKGFFLSAEDFDFSTTGQEHVACEDIVLPEGFKIALKASVVQQVLGNMESDNVRLELTDPSRAVLIKEDDEKSQLLGLVMPMVLTN